MRLVFLPSLPSHLDAEAVATSYKRHGSLLSFRLAEEGEEIAPQFSDTLATYEIIRYALSFDGLCSKVNHHKSVSEYFTPGEALRRNGIEQLVRLGVGVEDCDDLCAALNWALHHSARLSDEDRNAWRESRAAERGL
ncbi:MAG: PLP-dependent transferase [Myxococcales bacterium]|nr:PLP-dependent transferase [Myxococcales bacterium]